MASKAGATTQSRGQGGKSSFSKYVRGVLGQQGENPADYDIPSRTPSVETSTSEGDYSDANDDGQEADGKQSFPDYVRDVLTQQGEDPNEYDIPSRTPSVDSAFEDSADYGEGGQGADGHEQSNPGYAEDYLSVQGEDPNDYYPDISEDVDSEQEANINDPGEGGGQADAEVEDSEGNGNSGDDAGDSDAGASDVSGPADDDEYDAVDSGHDDAYSDGGCDEGGSDDGGYDDGGYDDGGYDDDY